MAEEHFVHLCRPFPAVGCFRCCPPIRPPDHDHLENRAFLEAQLDENTLAWSRNPKTHRPIDGGSCWGLGFLDSQKSAVGCLLHPGQNEGRDWRDLTGYGPKCRRELCLEGRVFAQLSPSLQKWTLGLACGLDSFQFSSPAKNPVFRLLFWGPLVIERLADESPQGLTQQAFFRHWEGLASILEPKIHRYAVELLLNRHRLDELMEPECLIEYGGRISRLIHRRARRLQPPLDNRPFVHQICENSLADFLRGALKIDRALPSEVQKIRFELHQILAEPFP